MSSDDQYEVQLKEQTRINEAMYHTKRYLVNKLCCVSLWTRY